MTPDAPKGTGLSVPPQSGEALRGDYPRLTQATRSLLASFGLTGAQRVEVWQAFLNNAEGVERCALRASVEGKRHGNTGAGLFLTMLRAGEHELVIDGGEPRYTGWRFVRGSHSGTYVRDPRGTDAVPPGYQV